MRSHRQLATRGAQTSTASATWCGSAPGAKIRNARQPRQARQAEPALHGQRLRLRRRAGDGSPGLVSVGTSSVCCTGQATCVATMSTAIVRKRPAAPRPASSATSGSGSRRSDRGETWRRLRCRELTPCQAGMFWAVARGRGDGPCPFSRPDAGGGRKRALAKRSPGPRPKEPSILRRVSVRQSDMRHPQVPK